jgi:hypothetical protein
MAEDAKLLLRDTIRSDFSDKMTCDMKSKLCIGGSRELYKLIVESTPTYMKTDPNHLQIISGIRHTFIRYKDDEFNRFLYIDPTIGQFDASFDGIFVGDQEDLAIIAERTKGQRYKLDLSDYVGQFLSVEKRLMELNSRKSKLIKSKLRKSKSRKSKSRKSKSRKSRK